MFIECVRSWTVDENHEIGKKTFFDVPIVQVRGEGYLPPLERSGSGTERAAKGRSAQAQRGRLGTLLVARQGRSSSGGLVTLLCAERRKMIWRLLLGRALRDRGR
jgi:hypothetical protein